MDLLVVSRLEQRQKLDSFVMKEWDRYWSRASPDLVAVVGCSDS